MELLLPKGYISWSALDLFEKSEQKYIDKYFFKKDESWTNGYMVFGKKFAKAKETGDCGDDTLLEWAVNATPSYGNAEYKLESVLQTPYGAIKLLSYLDDYQKDLCKILEYKTGTTPWTQAKVQKHGQLHFYAVSINSSIGINPEQSLIWIPTTDKDDNGNKIPVRPTGDDPVTFPYQASLFELKEMEKRITRAVVRIDKLYREHLKNNPQ